MYENDRYYLLTEEELEHFGIKGMKWGVRRTPEQLGHKREKTPEQLARSAKRKALAKKVAKYGAVVAFGSANMKYALTSQVGKECVKLGSQALSQILNIQDRSYRNVQSLAAQKLTQQLNGSFASKGGYTNLQSTAAQKATQRFRSGISSISNNMTQKEAMELLFGKK